MRKLRKIPFTIILSVILVFVIAFCISGTVISQSSHASRIDEKYYREMEAAYVKEIRSLLADKGYENSGITMTHVTDEDGVRTYTVTIHHGRIDKLSEAEKQELLARCGEIAFPDDTCGFCYEILHG
ncbi:MAG: hypothetical protein ACI4SD_07305 [Suilimivivens sp.]